MLKCKWEIPQWVHVATSLEGEDKKIKDVEIWEQEWEPMEGEVALVKDPNYGQTHRFSVYRIQKDEKVVEFAAGEFSNGVWGFYLRNKNAA